MKHTRNLTLLLITLFASSTLLADEGFYAGLRAANVTVNEDEIDDLKDLSVDIEDAGKGSLLVGYDFGGRVAIEVEMGKSEHDIRNAPYQQLELSTLGLYVAYRSQGQWFFKARGGLLSRKIELMPTITEQEEDTEGLISLGLGGGVRLDKFAIEAELSTIEAGIYAVGLNGLYYF